MKTLGSLLLIQAVSLATAGIIIPSTKIIEGPSSKTTLVGPDGSVITSIAQGAKIVTDGHSALVAAPDTLSVLKEADQPAVIEPLIAVKSVPAVQPIIAHDVPVVAARTVGPVIGNHVVAEHVGTKTTISEQSQIIAHPVPVIKSHYEPVIEAKPIVASYNVPIVETHAVPAIASKTTVSEYSQAIAHPSKPVYVQTDFVPAIAVEAHHVAPALAVEAYPHAIAQPANIVKFAEPLRTGHIAHNLAPTLAVEGPVITKQTYTAIPAIGTKTTISGHSQSVIHHVAPPLAVEAYPHAIAQPANIVKFAEPLRTGHIAHHVAPTLAVEGPVITKQTYTAIPAIGTKTTISGHSQSVIHPVGVKAVPVISEVSPVVTAKLVNQHAIPVVADHAVPVVTHHAVPIIGAETKISEYSQSLVSHSW